MKDIIKEKREIIQKRNNVSQAALMYTDVPIHQGLEFEGGIFVLTLTVITNKDAL